MKLLRLTLCVAAIALLTLSLALCEAEGPLVVDASAPEAYMNDLSLTEVVIAKDSPGIGARAFMGCANLTRVTLPYGVWDIGEDAFAGCDQVTICGVGKGPGAAVPEYAEKYGISFEDRRETDPDGFEYVVDEGECTIVGYRGQTGKVAVPGELAGCPVVRIGMEAFDEFELYGTDSRKVTRLESVSIPSGVRQICESAFQCCERLKEVRLEEGLDIIETHAFYACDALEAFHIPASVRRVQGNPFASCYSLTGLTVDAGNTRLSVRDGILYDASGARLLCCPASKKGKLDIPFGVREIAEDAFGNCIYLSEINLPDTVTAIGSYAFWGCVGIEEFRLPVSLERVDASAFSTCRALKGFEVSEDNPRFRSVLGVLFSKDLTRLICAPSTMTGTFAVPKAVVSVEENAFRESGLSEIVLPDGVKKLSKEAFSRCEAITALALPATVSEIGEGVFSECTALRELALPEGLTEIPANAFADCASLVRLTVPASVAAIDDSAFAGCAGLTLMGEPGSFAEGYAARLGIPFVVAGTQAAEVYETLQKGDKGQAVQAMQQKLIDRGFLKGKADGDYGRKTAEAVAAFQRSAGLAETGVADDATQAALFAG